MISRCPAATRRGLPRQPSTPSPLPSVRPDLGGAAPVPSGARSYARMARRLPPARPDGYSTSDGEADEDEPIARALEEEEDLEPRAGADGEDSEGSEMEGFMLEFGSGSDDEEEEGAEEGDKVA
ncbi:hypothetical protein EJB05_51306, partial [Eragrostis curvula]